MAAAHLARKARARSCKPRRPHAGDRCKAPDTALDAEGERRGRGVEFELRRQCGREFFVIDRERRAIRRGQRFSEAEDADVAPRTERAAFSVVAEQTVRSLRQLDKVVRVAPRLKLF